MNSDLFKRVSILLALVVVVLGGLMLFSYDVIKIDWVSFMEIQPSFHPMMDPLPVPADSIPVEGPAFVPGMGAPVNPVTADAVSISRGAELYSINCALCHGTTGQGNGPIATYLQNKPADLTGVAIQSLSDGAVFMVISTGVQGKMPALNENLTVRERWDVVNFVRTLLTPAPTPAP
jgi:mono/diheme cytochrome c family protein